ncbi:MAG: aldehyde dehydrogenase family protein, partial [Bacteroidota bacterium]
MATTSKRIPIQKTYKLYIGGKFPRTESGRYFKLLNAQGDVIANVCRGSKKDIRDAVVAARKGFGEWSKKTAYNRGQILYRIAETLEGRKAQFIETLCLQGMKPAAAMDEVLASIDRIVYYAGWCDKYQQIFSAVNPVESSHFNFTFPEPTGVVTIIAPSEYGLLGLVSTIMPAIASGNTVVALASDRFPLTAIELAEVIHASDVSGGTINILTGHRKELLQGLSNHMDVNATIYCGKDKEELSTIRSNASLNV